MAPEELSKRLSIVEQKVAKQDGTNTANWSTQFQTNRKLEEHMKGNAARLTECSTGIAVIKSKLAVYAAIIVVVIGFIAPLLRAWITASTHTG